MKMKLQALKTLQQSHMYKISRKDKTLEMPTLEKHKQ